MPHRTIRLSSGVSPGDTISRSCSVGSGNNNKEVVSASIPSFGVGKSAPAMAATGAVGGAVPPSLHLGLGLSNPQTKASVSAAAAGIIAIGTAPTADTHTVTAPHAPPVDPSQFDDADDDEEEEEVVVAAPAPGIAGSLGAGKPGSSLLSESSPKT